MKKFKIGDILIHKEFNVILVVDGWCAWKEPDAYACSNVLGMYIYPLEYLKDYYVKVGSLL
jgi:hypothetical protein